MFGFCSEDIRASRLISLNSDLFLGKLPAHFVILLYHTLCDLIATRGSLSNKKTTSNSHLVK